MNNDGLILTPLQDAPLAPAATPRTADKARSEEATFRALLEPTLAAADPEGFAAMRWGQLLDAAAEAFGATPDMLAESPWLVRRYLLRIGLACAPDAMLERRKLKPDNWVILYPTQIDPPLVRTRGYKKALLFVKFITLVLPDLSQAELEEAQRILGTWVKNERYRRHLAALIRWFGRRRRLLDARTARTAREILTPDDSARMLSALALACGHRGPLLPPVSLVRLEKVARLLGASEADPHALIHRALCGQPLTPDVSDEKAVVDQARLGEVAASTSEAQAMLSEVFSAGEEPPVAPEPSDSPAAFLRLLLSRPEWSMSGLEQEWGSPVGRDLEKANDFAIERIGDTVADREGDTVYVTEEYKDTLLSAV